MRAISLCTFFHQDNQAYSSIQKLYFCINNYVLITCKCNMSDCYFTCPSLCFWYHKIPQRTLIMFLTALSHVCMWYSIQFKKVNLRKTKNIPILLWTFFLMFWNYNLDFLGFRFRYIEMHVKKTYPAISFIKYNWKEWVLNKNVISFEWMGVDVWEIKWIHSHICKTSMAQTLQASLWVIPDICIRPGISGTFEGNRKHFLHCNTWPTLESWPRKCILKNRLNWLCQGQ